jgi:glycosyltransferase involved in cell wall biosynthesis
MDKLIEFTVPVYKTDPELLTRCIKSILDAVDRADIRDLFQLVIVNDCSPNWESQFKAIQSLVTDKGGEIGENILIANHNVNKGLGESRNTGLRYSKAKWVWFVDSDDTLPEFGTNPIIAYLKSGDADKFDIIRCNTDRVDKDGNHSPMYFNTDKCTEVSARDCITDSILYPAASWTKIFKVDSIKKSGIKFPKGFFIEDQVFTLRYLLTNPKIKLFPTSVYEYHEVSDSTMMMDWDVRHLIDVYKYTHFSTRILKDYNLYGDNSRTRELLATLDRYNDSYEKLSTEDKYKLNDLISEFKSNFLDYLNL